MFGDRSISAYSLQNMIVIKTIQIESLNTIGARNSMWILGYL